MMKGIKYSFLGFLFVLFSVSAQSKKKEQIVIYKWTENGQVNYGRFPPSVGTYTKLDSQGVEIKEYGNEFDVVQKAVKPIRPEQEDKKLTKETPEEKKKKETSKKNCDLAKKNLTSLKSGESYSKGADGNLIKITPKEIQTKSAQATKDIAYFCNE